MKKRCSKSHRGLVNPKSKGVVVGGIFSESIEISHSEIWITLVAARIIEDVNNPSRDIIAFIDILAAIKALDSNEISSKMVYNCRTFLNELAEQYDVHITWIPWYQINWQGTI